MSLRIQIQGLHDVERFQRPLEVITGLFFDEYELALESIHDADIAVMFSVGGDKRVHVHGTLMEKSTGNKYEADYEKDVSVYHEEKDRFKQIKYAVLHVYLALLQQYTGLIQQWGVLTGIRPVKLLHQK